LKVESKKKTVDTAALFSTGDRGSKKDGFRGEGPFLRKLTAGLKPRPSEPVFRLRRPFFSG
jgi:hypothetical protein